MDELILWIHSLAISLFIVLIYFWLPEEFLKRILQFTTMVRRRSVASPYQPLRAGAARNHLYPVMIFGIFGLLFLIGTAHGFQNTLRSKLTLHSVRLFVLVVVPLPSSSIS